MSRDYGKNVYDLHLDDYILNKKEEAFKNIEPQYYNWDKTFSFDADVTMVVSARGLGKTYGLRLQFVRDYIKRGKRFVELSRYKNMLSAISDGYFEKIMVNEEFPDFIFKTTPQKAFILPVDKGEFEDTQEKVKRKEKLKWECFGYFSALTDEQMLKRTTRVGIKRILLDEAILDATDVYHRYLPNEAVKLADFVDTVSRERADVKSDPPRVYLLANALDMFNPYFVHYGIDKKPPFGYSWHKNKTMLLDYVDDKEYSIAKATGTVAGRMLYNTAQGNVRINNEFAEIGADFIERKTSEAVFMFGVVYNSNKFAIWLDMKRGFYYISKKFPKSHEKPIFTLTADDARINYVMARKADPNIRLLADAFYMGIMRFETISVMNYFLEVLQLYGVRR